MKTDSFPRSPYETVHGLVYFGRMLDKIRLNAAGKLPEAYIANLGHSEKFDGNCLRFLRVDYEDLKKVVLAGATDEEAWNWCLNHGKTHTQEEIMIWNQYMRKAGWRDSASEILQRRLKEGGYEDRTDIQTLFDFLDLDEEGEKKSKRKN
ncbi:MAG: DUF5069 domain-containing protein [Chthoniobacterales bacterium]|nr:DUF5069 domain-containing protein [Chthoniobacterales bacterium]